MKRIAVYYRVSTKKQDHEIQEAAFRDWYQQPGNGGRVYVYRDVKSGAAKVRPNFDRMMELVRAGKIDHVVVYSIDRFSRSRAAGLETVLELIRLKVAFTSITQAFLCTSPDIASMPFQNVLLAAFTEIAAIERETIQKRVKDGMAIAKASGKRLGKQRALSPSDEAKVKALYNTTRTVVTKEGKQRVVVMGIRQLSAMFDVGHSCIHRIVNDPGILNQVV